MIYHTCISCMHCVNAGHTSKGVMWARLSSFACWAGVGMICKPKEHNTMHVTPVSHDAQEWIGSYEIQCNYSITYNMRVTWLFHVCVHRAIELANSIETDQPLSIPPSSPSPVFLQEYVQYHLGKSLYDLREFRHAAHALRACKSDEAFFLRCYCLYLVRKLAEISPVN